MAKENNSDMNEELKQWIQESKKDIKSSKHKKNQKPKGFCQICGQRNASIVCIKCGRSVCSSCHFKLIGVCKKCVPPEIAGKWDGSKPDWEKELGVDWVD
jgi:hypothetical protein